MDSSLIYKWSDFVLKHPKGSIFQSPEFYYLHAKFPKHEPIIILTEHQNSISGILLAIIHKEHSGFVGTFTARSIIIGGPLIKDDRTDYLQDILHKYFETIKGKAIYTQFRNLWDWSIQRSIFENFKFHYDPHLDIIIDLTDRNKLEEGISINKRRNVIKSRNKGLVFREIYTFNEQLHAIDLVLSTYKKIGLPCPSKDYFIIAFQELFPKGYIKAFGAFLDDKILIGARLELIFREKIYDWYAGSNEEMANKYPNDFIIYHILFWGHEHNFKIFDFGGAGKTNKPYGVREHKLKFSKNLVEFGRFEYIHKRFYYFLGSLGLVIYKWLNDIRK